jgi:hypothetical protein
MTCKHCGQPINRDITTYWVHTATKLVMCEDREHCAEES